MPKLSNPASGKRHSTLRRHLGVLLLLKFVALGGLWHTFVRPHRVSIDPAAMSQRLTTTHISTIQGEQP